MNSPQYDYAVIGGDLRQVYLARELAGSGFHVCHYALCQPIESFFSSNDTSMPAPADSLEESFKKYLKN